jgi:hypothetical protein
MTGPGKPSTAVTNWQHDLRQALVRGVLLEEVCKRCVMRLPSERVHGIRSRIQMSVAGTVRSLDQN